ncbi:MAG: exodeoxyribonuclease VII small subunit [Clostridia bacterium]|nr:exodeoxyribonuclease VII small subunit [Clostridia bacterium]
MSEKIDFEKALKSLEEVVSSLEKGDRTLEEAIALFEKGMANVKDCQSALKEAEIKIIQLSEAE